MLRTIDEIGQNIRARLKTPPGVVRAAIARLNGNRSAGEPAPGENVCVRCGEAVWLATRGQGGSEWAVTYRTPMCDHITADGRQ